MSSSGTISNVFAGAPTTPFGEEQRQSAATVAGLPGIQQAVITTHGMITEIHSSAPMIRATDRIGRPIANNQWIPLVHSMLEIRERFGKLRLGLSVMVSHTGPDGSQAIATITGIEGEVKGEGIQLENSVQKGLYAVFTPGIGLG